MSHHRRRPHMGRNRNATRSLEQTTYWTDKSGRTRRIDHMEASHRRALLNYLRRWSTVILYKSPDGKIKDLDPVEWIEQKPLVKRLMELVAEDEQRLPSRRHFNAMNAIYGRR